MPKTILLIGALPEEADAFLPGQGSVIQAEPHSVRLIERGAPHIKIVTCGLG